MKSRQIRQAAFWVVLTLAIQGSTCPPILCASLQPVERTEKLRVGEFQRAYRLHLPPTYDGTTPLPLVLVFHGRLETDEDIAEITQFSKVADQQNFIVVYPVGIHKHWNDGRNATPIWGAGNYDDVGFIQALLEHLQATLAIDPRRLYATGMSNGAMFVQRLACELPDTFAAIGPVAGTLPSTLAPQCTGPRPLSVIEFHGTKDAFVLWAGGSVRAVGGKTLSVPMTVAHWRQLDGCSGPLHVDYLPHSELTRSSKVRRETAGRCQDGSEVVLYAIEGGGHTWPGGPDDPLLFAGEVNYDLSATHMIWSFFAQHSKPAYPLEETALQENVPETLPGAPGAQRPTPPALQPLLPLHWNLFMTPLQSLPFTVLFKWNPDFVKPDSASKVRLTGRTSQQPQAH